MRKPFRARKPDRFVGRGTWPESVMDGYGQVELWNRTLALEFEAVPACPVQRVVQSRKSVAGGSGKWFRGVRDPGKLPALRKGGHQNGIGFHALFDADRVGGCHRNRLESREWSGNRIMIGPGSIQDDEPAVFSGGIRKVESFQVHLAHAPRRRPVSASRGFGRAADRGDRPAGDAQIGASALGGVGGSQCEEHCERGDSKVHGVSRFRVHGWLDAHPCRAGQIPTTRFQPRRRARSGDEGRCVRLG
jgi:hypothetical protein